MQPDLGMPRRAAEEPSETRAQQQRWPNEPGEVVSATVPAVLRIMPAYCSAVSSGRFECGAGQWMAQRLGWKSGRCATASATMWEPKLSFFRGGGCRRVGVANHSSFGGFDGHTDLGHLATALLRHC